MFWRKLEGTFLTREVSEQEIIDQHVRGHLKYKGDLDNS